MSFQAIPGNIPELEPEILKDLSTDQEILYRLAVGVTSGNVTSELSARKLGPLNMARWLRLTLAARTLRLYVSTAQPSEQLRTLAEFIVVHYVPMWFEIKRNPHCKNGSKNLFRSVELLRPPSFGPINHSPSDREKWLLGSSGSNYFSYAG